MQQSQQGQTHHNMNIKSTSASPQRSNQPPIYQATTDTQMYSSGQGPRVQQQIDIKNIIISLISKAAIIVLYYILSDLKLLDFIFVMLLVSMDFWMCKNIYGKKLAGLRWWIELDSTTEQENWIFQSADPNVVVHFINYGVFWISNGVVCFFWLVNFLIVLFFNREMFWIGLSMFCFALPLVNLACFYKCRGSHQRKAQEIMQKVGLANMFTLESDAESSNRIHGGKVGAQINQSNQNNYISNNDEKFDIE